MRLINLYCFLLIFNFGYSQSSEIPNRDTIHIKELDFNEWLNSSKVVFESMDSLLKVEPIDYLRYLGTFKYDFNDSILLKRLSMQYKKAPPMIMWKYTINKVWIKKEDVDTLMKFVYSKQPAHIPYPIISSMIPQENTTIGIEAMHLINIYRNKEFHYPSLCSTYYFCKPENQDSLADKFIEWWKLNK